jgi:hypothetical protein
MFGRNRHGYHRRRHHMDLARLSQFERQTVFNVFVWIFSHLLLPPKRNRFISGEERMSGGLAL